MTTAYTADEALSHYMDHVRAMVKYWAHLPEIDQATGRAMTIEDRCEGVAFSILTMIDGCSALPGLNLTLDPHPDDKAHHIAEGNQYYQPDMCINGEVSMHEILVGTKR